jgi:hypothetical protein
MLRDRVSPGTLGLAADGAFDGTLTVTLSGPSPLTVTRLQLQSSAPGSWDTDAASPAWALGVAATLDGPLLNDPGPAAVNLAVPDGGSLRLFAADYADLEFVPGATLTVTATLADGSTLTGQVVVSP